jgi:putative transposase
VAMVERPGPLSLSRQCQLLGLNRAALYYQPAPVDAYELELMVLLDRQYLRTPFYGTRRMTAWLQTQGHAVNRKRVQRLMQRMGLAAIYQRPRTSQPASAHRIYPYLLRGLRVERVHQVWVADITYIPMARGFLYLVAVMDWVSRYVLAWRLSNLLDADFCIEALEEALRQGRPEIFNTDQGSQFTGDGFTGVLRAHGVAISMDGRGRFADNIFVERLWRSLKYEEVYLRAYENVAQARQGIAAYFEFYNHQRLHQALGYRTPHQLLVEGLRMSPTFETIG